MSFSRLLLAAANSKKFIRGRGEDKVIISPKISEPHRDPYEGEVILCFQLDDRSTEQSIVVPFVKTVLDQNEDKTELFEKTRSWPTRDGFCPSTRATLCP